MHKDNPRTPFYSIRLILTRRVHNPTLTECANTFLRPRPKPLRRKDVGSWKPRTARLDAYKATDRHSYLKESVPCSLARLHLTSNHSYRKIACLTFRCVGEHLAGRHTLYHSSLHSITLRNRRLRLWCCRSIAFHYGGVSDRRPRSSGIFVLLSSSVTFPPLPTSPSSSPDQAV